MGVVRWRAQYSSSTGRTRPRSRGNGGSQSARCSAVVIPGYSGTRSGSAARPVMGTIAATVNSRRRRLQPALLAPEVVLELQAVADRRPQLPRRPVVEDDGSAPSARRRARPTPRAPRRRPPPPPSTGPRARRRACCWRGRRGRRWRAGPTAPPPRPRPRPAASPTRPVSLSTDSADPRPTTRTRTPRSSRAAVARTCAATSAGDAPSPRSTVSTRPACSSVRCRRASGTNTVRAACCCASSANSPASSAREHRGHGDADGPREVVAAAEQRGRRDRRRPLHGDEEGGRRRRAELVGEGAADRAPRARWGPVIGRPCSAQNRSSTPKTRTLDARRPLASSATTPVDRDHGRGGDARRRGPVSPASASRKKPPARTTWATPPSRRSAMSRRLAAHGLAHQQRAAEHGHRGGDPEDHRGVHAPVVAEPAADQGQAPSGDRDAARLRRARAGRGSGAPAPGCG